MEQFPPLSAAEETLIHLALLERMNRAYERRAYHLNERSSGKPMDVNEAHESFATYYLKQAHECQLLMNKLSAHANKD